MARLIRLPLLLSLLFTAVTTIPAPAAEQMVIDNFDYPSAQAARTAWQPVDDCMPVELIERKPGKAFRLSGDLPLDVRRAAYDRTGNIDLSTFGLFTLDVYVDNPDNFPRFTIYFHSGDGWYTESRDFFQPGWYNLKLKRARFSTEGHPAGWDSIDRIRLAAWRGEQPGGNCIVDNLVAHRSEIAVVIPTHYLASAGGRNAVRWAVESMNAALEGAGIYASQIGDEEVEDGELSRWRLLIFPYHPDLSSAKAERIRQFVAGGGKIMLFANAPHGLDALLGIETSQLNTDEYEGELSTIRFEPGDIVGLPEQIEDQPWKLTVPQPIGQQAQVIGWWCDSKGNKSDYPAITVSESGSFMSDVFSLSSYVPEQKASVLLSLIGYYTPEALEPAVEMALNMREKVGHLEGAAATEDWIAAQADQLPNTANIQEELTESKWALNNALSLTAYPKVLPQAVRSTQLLEDAYLLAHRSPPAEFRACWCHMGGGSLNWPVVMKNLHENGFNAFIPNVSQGGSALYESEYLPVASTVATSGDQLAQAVEAARQYGIEVHAWRVNYMLMHQAPEEFRERMRREGRLQMDYSGQELDWLNPSDPRNVELEVNAMVEMASKYDVDGIHFDYLRYPRDGGYSPQSRQRFERDTGIQIQNWPEDTRNIPDVAKAWEQWRCDQITKVARRTAEAVRKIKPHCQISLAAKRTPRSRGQDWLYWIEQGWLDFICPMDYTLSDKKFARMIADQLALVKNRVPVYPGIHSVSMPRQVASGRTAGQIQITRALGADGFTIFAYRTFLSEQVLPALARAVTSQPAIPPHGAPSFSFDIGQCSLKQTYGRHVPEGATVTATVRREEEAIAGRDFGEVSGTIVLQDADGQVVRELGPAPTTNSTQEVIVSAQKGLYRLVIVGEYRSSDGNTDKFVTRSLPIVFGEIPDDISALF